jgi:hypothetical protein
MTHVTREPAQVFIEHLMCDCGGEMQVIKSRAVGWRAVIQDAEDEIDGITHACNKCKKEERVYNIYPRLRYEPAAMTTMAEASEEAIKAQDISLGKRLLDIHEAAVDQ